MERDSRRAEYEEYMARMQKKGDRLLLWILIVGMLTMWFLGVSFGMAIVRNGWLGVGLP